MQAYFMFFVTTINFHFAVSAIMNDGVPIQCQNLTYCTVKPKNYPEEKFNNMFKHQKVLAEPSLLKDVITFENRQGDPSDSDNCEAEVSYKPLYQVREKRDSEWRTVVQAPSVDYVQRVRLEKCLNPDANCFTVFSPLKEFVTFCKQKYLAFEILVEKGENETEKIKAELPVCCSCHYKSVT